MRIGVDARELCGRATGVGRYLRGLLQQWSVDDPTGRHEFVLYSPEPIAATLDARRFSTRVVSGAPGTWWEQARLPRAAAGDHLDVWFSPGYTTPLLFAVPTVVAIHDLSFVAHPEWFRLREGLRRRWLCTQAARQARAVITISEFSKRELIDRLDVPDARIHVIPPGVTIAPSTISHQPSIINHDVNLEGLRAEGSGLPETPRVLFVGSIFNRRHVTDLIRAFAPIARTHPDASLDIVGDNRSFPYEDLQSAIDTEGVPAQVQWHQYVTDEQLGGLYANARAFAFLSEYEGLGLTPLEALGAGVPPVLLDTAVARESCGDAAVYVPPNSLTAITQAIEAVLFDGSTRSRILNEGPAVLARYSWPRAGRETLAVIEDAGSA